MIINQLRKYEKDFTESELYLPESPSRFCWVLEDPRQFEKIAGETCIPEGVYRVTINRSNRFKKEMMLLYNTIDLKVKGNDMFFSGIRPHGGNDVGDTEGCPLCAFNSDRKGSVWERASDALFDRVRIAINSGEPVYWIISKKPKL